MIKKILLITILVSTVIFQSQIITSESLEGTKSSSYSIEDVDTNTANFPIVFKSIGIGGEEHLKTNILKNSGFEEEDANYGGPEDFNYYGSYFRSYNRSYDFTNDASSYSGRIITRGTALGSINTPMYYDHQSEPAYLSESIDLDLDYYIVSNPDIDDEGSVYIQIRTSDGSTTRYLYYYLSANQMQSSNSTNYVSMNYNNTIGEWHHFSRNVTADFEEYFGVVPSVYIYRTYFTCYSPLDATGNVEAVCDNVAISNTTYNYLHLNGDFELGNGNYWSWYGNQSPGFVSLTELDFTEGTRAVNITAKTTTYGYTSYGTLYDYIGVTSNPYTGYYFSEPNMTTIEFDWKYTETKNGSNDSFAYFRVRAANETCSAFLFWVLGAENNQHYFNNYSDASYSETYFLAPDFGAKGTWKHAQFDLYEYFSEMNLTSLSVYEYMFNINSGSAVDDSVEFLIDDFQFITYPTSDPGFEQDYYWSSSYPLTGWWSSGYPNINRTTDSHSGDWAANVTSTDFDWDEMVYRETFMTFEDDYFTDFWWKIDKMAGSYVYTCFELEFEGGYGLYYILGGSDVAIPSNSSYNVYYLVDNYNETDVWNNLVRNVVSDLNEAFTPAVWNMTRLIADSLASSSGSVMSTLFDDIHFVQDTRGPEITSVVLQNAPTFYEPAIVNIEVSDMLSGIETVMMYYQNDSIWYSTEAILSEGVYIGTIPVSDALTEIKFYINATDKYGFSTIDDNLGAYYTYSVNDDIDPLVTIVQPINDSTVEGTILISADCSDAGSGIDYVEFYEGAVLLQSDSSYPYEYNWNTRTVANGTHTITAIIFDNAGNSATSEVIINTQNDFAVPFISEVFLLPVTPQHNQKTDVIVAIGDISGIQNVTLNYKIGSGIWNEQVMTSSGSMYNGSIPAAPYSTLVSYYVVAFDENDQFSSAGSELSPLIYNVGDDILPTLTVDGPPTAEILKGEVVFQIEGVDYESGIASVQVLIDGEQDFSQTSLPQEFIWETTDYDNGERVIVFQVTDVAGNSKEISLVYTIDNPDGFIEESRATVDLMVESYGVFIGAGGVVIIYLVAKLMLWRRGKKTS
jgi:hypothetical protein